jgi:hypothetical protein
MERPLADLVSFGVSMPPGEDEVVQAADGVLGAGADLAAGGIALPCLASMGGSAPSGSAVAPLLDRQPKQAPGNTEFGGRRPLVGNGDGRLREGSRPPKVARSRAGSSS